ncbi:MAG TPA: lipocalin-like domain-containing protein [Bryobacteraceae bacterium]|nr:lipocalin-like domain-containing protein [Bryobacteraceae bacterium]
MKTPARARFLVILCCTLAGRGTEADSYRLAVPGYHYAFPRDHFEHPDFRTEWWYFTGNVRDSEGKRFGFELVFFRQGERRGEPNRSAWRVDDLYLAHLALTDIDGRHFYHHERLNRAGPGLAGASFAERRVWNGNWSARWEGAEQVLEATADEFHFRLRLAAATAPVINGINGVSQKADGAGRASYYVSLPRLITKGELQLNGEAHAVTGTAWMDHEWFTHQLDENQVGWDWFSIQLDNETELMVFQIRRKGGGTDVHSSGTYVDRQGRSRHLSREDFSLTPFEYWKSPRTGASYPTGWRVRVPSLKMELNARAALEDQELTGPAGPAYWEGAVNYSGSATGVGYLEMTGYTKPVQLE